MADLNQITLTNGIPTTGTGTVATINALMADGGQQTIGNKADSADPATGPTPVSVIGILKQISLSVQAFVSHIPTALGSGGGLKVDGSGTPLPVSVSALPSHDVYTLGKSHTPNVTFTCGTTAYAANDVVGVGAGTGVLTFTNAAANSGQIMIFGATLEIDTTALISGEAAYRLYLYTVTPPSAFADSALWDLSTSGDRLAFLGWIDFATPTDLGSTLYTQVDNINKQVKVLSSTIFGYLVSIGPYTPTARVFTVTLQTRDV